MTEEQNIIKNILIHCIGTADQKLWNILYPYVKKKPEILIDESIIEHFSKNLNTQV